MTNLDDVMDVDGEWSVEEATAEAGGLLALLDANVTTTEADGVGLRGGIRAIGTTKRVIGMAKIQN